MSYISQGIAAVLLLLYLVLMYLFATKIVANLFSSEKFRDIDYEAEKKEQQQLYQDFYQYDYKNYDFTKTLDKDGNIKIPANFEAVSYYENNQNFTPAEYSLPTSLGSITTLNENVDLPLSRTHLATVYDEQLQKSQVDIIEPICLSS